jgi:hypothetical protein
MMTVFGLELIKKLKPIKFRYDSDKFDGPVDNRIHFGFVAQDLEQILSNEEFAMVTKDPRGFFMINYVELISPLAKSIQELEIEVESLKGEIRLLKNKLK